MICEQEGQRNNTTLGGSALVQGQADLVLVVHLHLDCSDKLARLVRFPHDDGCLGWVGWMSDLNIHTRGGGNDPLHGVRLETVALNKNIGLEKSKAPGVRIAGQETQPTVEVGKVGCGGRRQTVTDLVVGSIFRDRETVVDLWLVICSAAGAMELASKVFNHGDTGFIAVVHILDQALDMTLVNVGQDVANRLIDNGGEARGHRALQDTGSADVLVHNGLQILTLPQRVFLEPVLKVLIQRWHKGHWFLPTALTEEEEMVNILGIDQLSRRLGVCRQDVFDGRVRSVDFRIVLQQGRLLAAGEAFLNTADEITRQSLEGVIDPPGLVLDKHQVDHAVDDLRVGHVLEINRGSGGIPTKPDLLEVVVQLFDDVVPLLFEFRHTLGLVELEDLLVHLLPEQHTPGGQLVNGLAHLRQDGDHTTGGALVSLLPVQVIQTGGTHDRLLRILGGVSLQGGHHAATEEASVKRHGRVAEVRGPGAGQVWVGVHRATEATSGHQDDVLMTADAAVHLQNGLVEVLERVVASTAATRPLHDDGELGVRLGDVDDLLDRIDGARFEGDMFDAQGFNVLVGDLDGRHAGTDRQTLDRHAIGP